MAITETQSVTGRGGNMKVNGVTIGITSWKGKVHKEFAVATDSNNYDPTTGQTWRSRAPGELWIEFSAELNYDLGGTTDANFTQKFKTDGPYPVILGLTPTTNFASFNADFDEIEFTMSVPGATMLSGATNGMSNGVVTLF